MPSDGSLPSGFQALSEQLHHAGDDSRKDGKSNQGSSPFPDPDLICNVWHQVFRTRDQPCFRMSDPPLINKYPVKQVHDHEDPCQLQESIPKTIYPDIAVDCCRDNGEKREE